MQKKSGAQGILWRQNPPFLFSFGPLMKNWGFVSQLTMNFAHPCDKSFLRMLTSSYIELIG